MRTSSEWTAACDVQQRFMQRQPPGAGTLDCGAQCRQVQQLGGDFYDFVPLSANRWALAIGDASGKGLPAALMISNVQSSLRTAASLTGNKGPAALRAVNRQVYGSSLAGRYATLFYGVFDRVNRTLRYVNAGHNPPMVFRKGGPVIWLETGGAPVGMFPEWTYEEGMVQLRPGDSVLAYTDGVIEAVNSDGEEWGVDRLLRTAIDCEAQRADDLVDAVFLSLDFFTTGHQHDDATVVALRVQ